MKKLINYKWGLLLVIMTISVIPKSFAQSNTELPIYKDINKTVEERVSDLLSKMTLEEKVNILGGATLNTLKNVRLGIPILAMTDGPLGPNKKGKSTNYSSMINIGATFNTELMYQVGEQLGEETRIIGRNMLLGPNINIARVPQNGRTFETFGEDPYLTSKMGVSYIKGVQSKNVVTSTKHFVANNQEWNRFVVDAMVGERALREIYLPAFKAAVQEADTWSVMAAYNLINGKYACENKYLLNDILKEEWGFTGFVVSDWGAAHSTVPMAKAGLDLEMPFADYYGEKLIKAIKEGEVSEANLNDKVSRILRVIFKAGLFDETVDVYGGISDQPHRRELALQVAEQSIVLLKNENNILPLQKNNIKTIAVIGPNGDVARMTGAGSGSLKGNYAISILQGIIDKAGDEISVEFSVGIPDNVISPDNFTTTDGKQGIYAEYYNNKEQEGEPVYTTIEKEINFNWGLSCPKEGVVNLDKWSAKWTGKLKSPGEGWYSVGLRVDNGARMYINGEKIIDVWTGGKAGEFNSVKYKFEEGKTYDIQVDFFENIGMCQCELGVVPLDLDNNMKEAADLAAKSDIVILALGIDLTYEGEGVDRKKLALDDNQLKLLNKVYEANKNVVVVLNNATPITMEYWIDKVPAVVEAFYPGQEGGNALANILFGDVNPSGKLPITFPRSEKETPVANSYPGTKELANYDEGIFVGYRWYDKKNIEPLFPFGFGLSYTNFEFSDLNLSKTLMNKEDELTIELTVKNTGKIDGDEIVQLYISDKEASVEREPKSLKGFQRISLKAGESKTVTFTIDKSALAFYSVNSKSWVVEPGEFEVLVGNSSRNILEQKTFIVK